MIAAAAISIQDYHYELPEEKIALFPLEDRDGSKLLVSIGDNLTDTAFKELPRYIPENSLMVFNNTKVIHARIKFPQTTGSQIEIFCLEPAGKIMDYSLVLNQKSPVIWKCFVGGAAKWKSTFLEKKISIHGEEVCLRAQIKEKLSGSFLIEFSWTPYRYSFSDIIEKAGDVPLPPYIKRTLTENDEQRYQTIFAETAGSVAAPTAGLHFTASLLDKLHAKNILTEKVTLHVGAGTFKPVQAATMEGHDMHAEWIDVSTESIQKIAKHQQLIVAVGTTSLRTMESMYWLGVKILYTPLISELELGQWDCYTEPLAGAIFSKEVALNALVSWLQSHNKTRLFTRTQLMITPGYSFKVAGALVTNFHQPHSTLLLLVAAVLGKKWKELYQHALDNQYRFLSFGDGSLLFMAES